MRNELSNKTGGADGDTEGFKAWVSNWREALTPTNVIFLILIVSTLGSLLRGEMTRDEAVEEIRKAAQEAVVAERRAAVPPHDTGLRVKAITVEGAKAKKSKAKKPRE